jgi:ribonucleoside-diphosphate reductase alpha chain
VKEQQGAAGSGESSTSMAPTQRKPGAWSEAVVRVLRERYLLRDANGKVVETPDELCWRVATVIASAESQWQDKTGITVIGLA